MISQERTSEPNEVPVEVVVTWTFALWSSLSREEPAWAGMTVVKSYPSVSVPVLVCPLSPSEMVLTW